MDENLKKIIPFAKKYKFNVVWNVIHNVMYALFGTLGMVLIFPVLEVLFKNEEKSSLFVPFNMFGYMMTEDQNTCDDALNFFQHQIKNSRLLNASGNRDKKIFFNKMYEQIENVKQKL